MVAVTHAQWVPTAEEEQNLENVQLVSSVSKESQSPIQSTQCALQAITVLMEPHVPMPVQEEKVVPRPEQCNHQTAPVASLATFAVAAQQYHAQLATTAHSQRVAAMLTRLSPAPKELGLRKLNS